MSNRLSGLAVSMLILLAVTAGCEQPTSTIGNGHGHAGGHGEAASFAGAVEQLERIRDGLHRAFEDGAQGAGYHPPHEVVALLDQLPGLAADANLSAEDLEEVKTEADRLFDAFREIDKAFHTKDSDKQATYDNVAATIDEAIAAVESHVNGNDHGDDSPEHAGEEHAGHDDASRDGEE